MKYKLFILGALLFSSIVSASEIDCLAKNIYFESRGEPEAGQFMVGFVTHNRVLDKRWPNTYCKVVYQPGQFEWTDRKVGKVKNKKKYNKAKKIAKVVMQSGNTKQYGYFFKRKDVKSSYFKKLKHIATINNHEFYK